MKRCIRSSWFALMPAAALALAGCGIVRATPSIGFWYDNVSFGLPPDTTARLGGPLTEAEIRSIEQTSRAELERAFDGLTLRVTDKRDAFWRVRVVDYARGRNTGESVGLGPLGGAGIVGFVLVALKAVQYAPAGATRDVVIAGIGRGIGRVAAHEFAHQILGPVAAVHNDKDERCYEYPSPDRAAQYYGDLRWTTAAPLLKQKLGASRSPRALK